MIITYMVYEVIKNRVDDETIKVSYCNDDLIDADTIEGEHFGLPVYKKNYPSCYQYNVIIMLAKRLLKEEKKQEEKKQNADRFANRLHLNRRFAERIFNSEV